MYSPLIVVISILFYRTWKFCQIGMELLMLLLRHDTPTPVCAVQLIAESCIHDSLSIRKVLTYDHNVVSMILSP